MNINVGDLVICKNLGLKLGVIVDKKNSNDGLNKSMHTKHLLSNYPKVYYVYLSGEGKIGPIYENDLSLQQSIMQDLT